MMPRRPILPEAGNHWFQALLSSVLVVDESRTVGTAAQPYPAGATQRNEMCTVELSMLSGIRDDGRYREQ